ncbi:MAG: 16S rRNA (cytidine(1402)-2'-O)-methyltransferase [Bacillota bacterium]|nr:16S rRNA (cytidine(1402)-2'-O)-methyltransferase [Bacillota bacterium]
MEENKTGTLYLVPTPIGNLKDITLRALEVLNSVDLIACEDTRHSLKLLNHYEIKKPLMSYHKFNEMIKCDQIIERLKAGVNIALISDAGMPIISDPGYVLIGKLIKYGMKFEVLPGANAALCGLIASSFSARDFIFKGFLPRDAGGRDKVLKSIKDRTETIIFYEAPHRLIKTLESIKAGLGNRNIAVCRELTKLHEEIIRDTAENIIRYFSDNPPKGEFVLVIQGKDEGEIEKEERMGWEDITIEDHIKKYMNEGFTKKEAVKNVAQDRKLSKNEVYKHSIDL